MTFKTLEEGLVIQLAVIVILAILGSIRRRFRAALDRQDPRLRPVTLIALSLFWFGANLGVLVAGLQFPWVSFVASTAVMAILEGREVGNLWSVGIHGADLHARHGIDSRRALSLCTNQLEFLGTGAWKLTKEKAFEAAVRQCHRSQRPVRLLLLDPKAGQRLLAEAATRAGFDRDEYLHRVKESLHLLAGLRLRSSLNIHVRFYGSICQFRLMFIDDSLCLASYNVYGEGDGSQLPQLHVVKRPGQRDVESFYYPLRAYFEQLWDSAIPWNPKEWE